MTSNHNPTHKPRMMYDVSSLDPRTSCHWEHLKHQPNDKLIFHSKELYDVFRADIGKPYNTHHAEATEAQSASSSSASASASSSPSRIEGPRVLALWSCIAGYIESLTTHKDPTRRYTIYPVPIDALRRLVDDEFITQFLRSLNVVPSSSAVSQQQQQQQQSNTTPPKDEHHHRQIVRTLSNAIWSKVQSYSSSTTKDELHANSLYVCLRGYLDKRTLDCFGSAIVTIAGLQLLEATTTTYGGDDDDDEKGKITTNKDMTLYPSFLTLSEDHAYESHIIATVPGDDNNHVIQYGTCEMAIPGTTKQIREKRGKPIEDHFRTSSSSSSSSSSNNGYHHHTTTIPPSSTHLTPETSWLYMRNNPIVCTTVQMSIAAAIGNINCTIETAAGTRGTTTHTTPNTTMTISASLCEMKRDLLWILYDGGYLSKFPFALIELGDCEEHCPSSRGNEWVYIPQLVSSSKDDLSYDDNVASTISTLPSNTTHKESATILRNEQLFLEAIRISQKTYNDAQTYPYFYAGHYHKDAGRILSDCGAESGQEEDHEYRLVEALRLYAAASRVASRYTYDSKDSLQLIKHMTSVASLIVQDILSITLHADDDDDDDDDNNATSKATTNNTKKDQPQQEPRPWKNHENAVAAATWLLAWFDSLLWWEEKKGQHFVEILNATHKHGIKKMFQLFSHNVRKDMITHVCSSSSSSSSKIAIPSSTKPQDIAKCDVYSSAITSTRLLYFQSPRSSRLAKGGLLIKALGKPKLMIGEMELTIVRHDDDSGSSGGGGGRRKRSRRNYGS